MFNHTRNSEVFADHLTVTLNSKSKIKLYNFVSMLHHDRNKGIKTKKLISSFQEHRTLML